MTRRSPIPLSELAESIGGFDGSRFFPPEAYTSEPFYRFDLAAVWLKEWIAVGRCEDIPATGDYFTVTVGDEPIVVIRDGDGIHAMSAADLAPVATADEPRELQPIVQSLNVVLGRLSQALDAERRFTADAAHELRTPLAALHMWIQLMQRQRELGEARSDAADDGTVTLT